MTDGGIPGGGRRCGTVALLGWTNVGKSTLLNRLVGAKIAAVADVAQTTRHRITGVHLDGKRGQIAFVDTPGLHRPRYRMNRRMVETARQAIRGVDVVAVVVDAARGAGEGDCQAAELVRARDCARMLVLNKVDLVRPKSKLLPMIEGWAREWGFPEVVPVSAKTGDGCDRLLDVLFGLLPEGPALFPEDYLTDQPERTLAAEFVREKLLRATRQELPHATAVVVEAWNQRADGLVEIEATILVDRESQKRIVIGRQGEAIKQIGVAARPELEQLLGRRIFLQLWVKVRPDWRNDAEILRSLGVF